MVVHYRAWLALGGDPEERLAVRLRILRQTGVYGLLDVFDEEVARLEEELGRTPSCEVAFAVALRRSQIGIHRSAFEEAREWGEEALRRAEHTSQVANDRTEARLAIARALTRLGELDRADALFRSVIADDACSRGLLQGALAAYALFQDTRGRGEDVRAINERLLAMPDLQPGVALAATANLGKLAYHDERLDDALTLYERARGMAREQGNRAVEAITIGFLGTVLDALGRSADAERMLHQAVALHRALGNVPGEAMVVGNIAVRALRRGALEEAAAGFSQALRLLRAGDGPALATWTRWSAMAALFLGQLDEARALAGQARTLAVAVDHRAERVWAAAVLGHLAVATGGDPGPWLEEARASASTADQEAVAARLANAVAAVSDGRPTLAGFAPEDLDPSLVERLRRGAGARGARAGR